MTTLLNCFGHGVPYDHVLALETQIFERQVETEQHGIVLPKSIYPVVLSTFCMDKIDILKETLSGRGTTHPCEMDSQLCKNSKEFLRISRNSQLVSAAFLKVFWKSSEFLRMD